MLLQLFLLSFKFIVTVCYDEYSNLNQLPLDENNRLSSHFLLFAGSEICESEVNYAGMNLAMRHIGKASKSLKESFFGSLEAECSLVCLEKGTFFEQINYPLPYQINKIVNIDQVDLWILNNCQQAEVGFINYRENRGIIYWINYNTNERVELNRFDTGERSTSWHTTYLGHKFEIEDEITHEILANYPHRHSRASNTRNRSH
jgi:hypothetical protein